MKKRALIVDLRDSDDNISLFVNNVYNQKLYCLCGNEQIINNNDRLNKDILITTGEPYINDIDGKLSVTCNVCGITHDSNNRPMLLFPSQPVMVEAFYSLDKKINDKKDKTIVLNRQRKYVTYDSVKSVIVYDNVIDTLTFNESTRKFKAEINNSNYKDAYYHTSVVNHKTNSNISLNNNSFSQIVDCSNLLFINTFFGYTPYLEYSGLECLENFLKSISVFIIDIDKIMNLEFINEEVKSLPISYNIKKGISIEDKKTYFTFSEFTEGDELVELHIGTYLETIITLTRLYVSILSFSHMSTLLFSKGFIFFDEFLKTNLIKTPQIYSQYNATNPYSILEVSVNYDEKGILKNKNKSSKEVVEAETEENNYFKVSNTIYKSIRLPMDIKKLYDFMQKKYISKKELEFLFHSYNINDIYDVIGIFSQHNFTKVDVNINHLKHTLKHKLYVNHFYMRFAEEYSDTINTLNQIVASKEKAKAFLLANYHLLPEDERASYKEYLSIDPKCIFKVNSHNKLKKLHDELSVIYSIFVDAEKAVSFLEAVNKFNELNQQIDSIKFSVIPSTKEMYREHIVMQHCINTYVNRVASGDYIVIRVLDTTSNEKATLGLMREGDTLTFNQLKGFENSRATKFLIDTVLEYCKKNKIKLENSNYFSVDLQPDKTKEKKMKDYLSEEEIILIRNKKLEKVVTASNSPLNNEQANAIIQHFKKQIN